MISFDDWVSMNDRQQYDEYQRVCATTMELSERVEELTEEE